MTVGAERTAVTQASPHTPSLSVSVCECQEKQKQGWRNISQRITECLNTIKNGTMKLKTLPVGVFGDLHCADCGAGESEGRSQKSCHPRVQSLEG